MATVYYSLPRVAEYIKVIAVLAPTTADAPIAIAESFWMSSSFWLWYAVSESTYHSAQFTATYFYKGIQTNPPFHLLSALKFVRKFLHKFLQLRECHAQRSNTLQWGKHGEHGL